MVQFHIDLTVGSASLNFDLYLSLVTILHLVIAILLESIAILLLPLLRMALLMLLSAAVLFAAFVGGELIVLLRIILVF